MSSEVQLRRIYRDIWRGFSQIKLENEPIYVKHLSVFDQTDIDIIKDEAFNTVRSRGIKTESEKLKWLNEKGLWTKKDEVEMSAQQAYVENLEKTKNKLGIKSQVLQVEGQLSEANKKLSVLINKRTRLIGLTAEQVAEQKIQHEHVRISFYKDSGLKMPRFTSEDISALSDEDADRLLYEYINVLKDFSPENIRRISITPWFINQFSICGENLQIFFGIPIANLSIYQANLLRWGHYFQSILTQNELPKDILDDPDKIERYMLQSRNLKNIVNKAGPGDRVAIIGGSADDFKAMGVEDGSSKVQADINRGAKSGLDALKTREATIR